MKRILSIAALVGLAALASPAAAQEHNPEMMGHMRQMDQMMQMMAPMMSAMAFEPDHLLARKDSLHLTAQQVTRLTALRDAAKSAHDAAADDAKAHMGGVTQTFAAASPDTAALKMHFQAAHSAMGNAHWAMLAAAAQAKAVLTDEQRARVDRWASRMMEREHREHH